MVVVSLTRPSSVELPIFSSDGETGSGKYLPLNRCTGGRVELSDRHDRRKCYS